MSAQMSTPMMWAPSAASRMAWLRPCPRATPVMNATLPSKEPIDPRFVARATSVANHEMCNCVTADTVTELLTDGKEVRVMIRSAKAEPAEAGQSDDRLLGVVVEMLESEGYDAVQLREVARRARTSLATIYKRFPTRDDLILAALEAWLEENRYAGVTPQPLEAGSSLYIGLMGLFRPIFEPWERHPAMLMAYFRARTSPSGQKL